MKNITIIISSLFFTNIGTAEPDKQKEQNKEKRPFETSQYATHSKKSAEAKKDKAEAWRPAQSIEDQMRSSLRYANPKKNIAPVAAEPWDSKAKIYCKKPVPSFR